MKPTPDSVESSSKTAVDLTSANQSTDKLYHTPFGVFDLKRIPDNDKNLQAWNSADLYMLNYLFEQLQAKDLDLETANILILNDAFGALTIPLAKFKCDSYNDSFISHEAIKKNLSINCPYEQGKVSLLKSTDNLTKHYDIVLFKEVKIQVFLKDEMYKVAQHISADTLLLGGIMAKNLQKSTLDILNTTVGEAQASLTWKKARLLHVKPSPRAKTYKESLATYQLEGSGESIKSLANVFSRNKLDIGTRFFLQHIPNREYEQQFKHIIDLGCGNGILALRASQSFPKARISCIDESYMAVASAQMTLEANLTVKDLQIDYTAANTLSDMMPESADLILCNPPFHQQYVIGDAIAWHMFKQSKKVLQKGGELWVVGNRHLDYPVKIKKIFGNQQLIAKNNKFVIIKAIKR